MMLLLEVIHLGLTSVHVQPGSVCGLAVSTAAKFL